MKIPYEERLDILSWNLKTKEGLLSNVDDISKALSEARTQKGKNKFNRRDRNWKMFVLRYQYRLTFGMIAAKFGVTLERVRQIVFHELRHVKDVLNGKQENVI